MKKRGGRAVDQTLPHTDSKQELCRLIRKIKLLSPQMRLPLCGMLDQEKQAKKQQDTEYEGAGGRANNQLKSYRLQYKALNHALASDIDCIYSID